MNLRTSEAYWLMKNGYSYRYPALEQDIRTDVCIMGAGITGALAAYALARAGYEVTVVEKRHPGMGSTAASTALLQYEIDEPLHTLSAKIGREPAEQAYRACSDAIDAIGRIIREEKLAVAFWKSPSLLYASSRRDVHELREEYRARQAAGLRVKWLEGGEVQKRFRIASPAAVYSAQGAQADAYKLAHALLRRPLDSLRVFDKTEVTDIAAGRRGVTLTTHSGRKIRARRLVVACGYESQRWLPRRVLRLSATYALASKPVNRELLWERRALIWETKTPYMYLRTTEDNRVIMGGRDDTNYTPAARDRALPGKIRGLLRDLRRVRPDLPLTVDFSWAGAFGGTRDSLPYIGSIPEMPNTWFILGYGGNGIVFSQTGAEIVRDALAGRRHPLAEIYSFSR